MQDEIDLRIHQQVQTRSGGALNVYEPVMSMHGEVRHSRQMSRCVLKRSASQIPVERGQVTPVARSRSVRAGRKSSTNGSAACSPRVSGA